MSAPTNNQLLHGVDSAPYTGTRLIAGPVTALLDGVDLRNVRLAGVELAQRIYVAVRDDVWNTVPAMISDVLVEDGGDHFAVTFTAHHAYADIDYTWAGRITGDRDGVITYSMDGTAGGSFRYAKIGFNVHHALDSSVARPYTAHTPAGEVSGTLPAIIDPQRFIDGRLTAIFPEYDSLTLLPADGVRAEFTFEGDLFEMQDHRNWTDANFKSYGTPLSVPWPMDATPGQTFHQAVIVRGVGDVAARTPLANRVCVTADRTGTLPRLGSLLTSEHLPLSDRERELVRRIGLDHCRVDVYLEDEDWRLWLRDASAACRDLELPLELALFVADGTEERLPALRSALEESGTDVARILVFSEGRGFAIGRRTTPADLMRTVRNHIADVVGGAPFIGGTNQFFAELNREYPDASAIDGAVYSMNPQTHAADDRSVMENLKGQEDTIATAKHNLSGAPVHVSPVTLVGRFGPYPGGPTPEGGLPGNVDPRQVSLLTAAWTVGTLHHMAQAGATSVTLFELVGWRGLVERDDGPADSSFPSEARSVFPVYDVLLATAPPHAWQRCTTDTTQPDAVEALALVSDSTLRVLIANITETDQEVSVEGLDGRDVVVEQLDAATVAAAPDRPRLRLGAPSQRVARALTLALPPYAVAVITSEEARS